VRAGYTFCAQKDDKRRNLDRCCNAGDFDCMWNQTRSKDTVCATQNQTFHNEN
jgi:hypothetical protein